MLSHKCGLKRLAVRLAVSWIAWTSAPAMADGPALPTPVAILERAKIDRFEFADTIEEMRGLLSYMKTRDVLFPYVDILDELKAIEISLNFPIFDQSPLKTYAGMLSKVTLRELGAAGVPADLLTDPPETIEALLAWGDDEDREYFRRQQVALLSKQEDLGAVRAVFDRFLETIELLDRLEPSVNVFQIEKFNQTQGVILARYIELAGVEAQVEDIASLAARMRTRDGFVLPLDQLLTDAIKSSRPELLRKIVLLAALIKDALQTIPVSADVEVMRKPSVIVGYVLGKLLQIAATLTDAETARAIEVLDETQLSQFVRDLTQTDLDRLQPHQLPFLLHIATHASERLSELGLLPDRDRAEIFGDRIRFLEKVSSGVLLDGLFDVQVEGRPGKMTFVRSGTVDAAVGINVGTVNYILGHARYEHETDEFVISSLPPAQGSVSGQTVHSLRLRFGADGRSVSGVIDTGLRSLELTGHRTSTYEDFFRRPAAQTQRFTGTYTGTIQMAGQRRDVRFVVARHSGDAIVYTGVLYVSGGSGPMRFEFGQHYSNYRNNVLYLTERESDSFAIRRLLQIRGHFTETGFVGAFIRGATEEVSRLELTRSAN